MSHCCDVENCVDTSATVEDKREISVIGRTYCVAGAPQEDKNSTHTLSISIHYFSKDVAVRPKWTRFDRRHRGDVTLQCQLRTGFEDGCYKHVPPAKSGEDGQWIQLKRMLIEGPVYTPYTIFPHSFQLTFRMRIMGELFIAVYFMRLRSTRTLCLSTWLHLHFSYRIKILPSSFHRII